MTDGELLAKARQCWEHWARHLAAVNWYVTFAMGEGHSPAMMTSRNHHYRKVLVTVYPVVEPDDLTDEGISRNVLHEVLHLLLCAQQDVIDSEFETDGLLFQRFRNALETDVDSVAAVIWRLHQETGCKE